MSWPDLSLTKDPAWPWSTGVGLPALAVVGLVLAGLTLWTYLGVRRTRAGRVGVVLALRLLALVLACLMALRPSLAFREDPREASVLLFVVDASESMTNQDEYGGQSRWENLQRLLKESEPVLRKLRDDQKVRVVFYRFAEDVRDLEPGTIPNGKRTDFGLMLHALLERHAKDRNFRGLLVLSDGADNGVRYPALTEAARWRPLPCPVQTFGFGKTTTADKQSDIAFAPNGIIPEPAPAYVKGKLRVKAVLDAPGFENAEVTVRLLMDDKEVTATRVRLPRTTGNEVMLSADAPPQPGEVKLTLKVDPLPNELSTKNNQIDTYLTVVKEGISVLLVDRLRFPEPQLICDALATDRRVRLYPAWRRGAVASVEGPDLFGMEKQHYDVIIVGDLSVSRLAGDRPETLEKVRELVRKGAGLLMTGGSESFANSDWQGTAFEDVMPVRLDSPGQVEDDVGVEPTPAGLQHYALRLADRPTDNEALWRSLPKLNGMTRLGTPKPQATVLAVREGTREPMLVGQQYGEGRVLAFAGDTTWRWQRLGQPRSSEGLHAHQQFWKQVVFWLAKQDRTEGSVWAKLESRRLAAGDKVAFSVGLRGKGGVDLKGGRFEVSVVGPDKAPVPVPTAREAGGERGTFWKTEAPGEYVLRVRGEGKDTDGKPVSDEARARFLVYQDDAETLRRAADHDFLMKLAQAGGGQFHPAETLPRFLRELEKQPLPQGPGKVTLWPDWRRNNLSGFLVGFFVLFVAVLTLEWFLRRIWDMV